MHANPAVQNIKSFISEEYLSKASANASLQRGLWDADAKSAFKTTHTLCLPSELVVVDEEGTCGYIVGVPGLDLVRQLTPNHPLLADDLLLPDLTNPTILLVQQPCLEIDFFGRIKRLDVQLDPLSDTEVKALYEERFPAVLGLKIACAPLIFDQSAECRTSALQRLEQPLRGVDQSLSDGEMVEDMVYSQFDRNYDALSAPSSSTASTPKIRRPRALGDVDINSDMLESMHRALSPEPVVPGLAIAGVNRPDASAHKNSTKESYPHALPPTSAGIELVQQEEGVRPNDRGPSAVDAVSLEFY
ncbi:hypothetical protein FS837_004771 [Tulasnella sp. UAMH 9824]|nr:hypothetical protein FS837_004771 [Tulasnella sp. UAMH 9824]